MAAVVVVSGLMLSQNIMLAHLDQVGWGADYDGLMGGTRRFLDGGGFYLPEQLAGPYRWPGPWMLYPPTMLLLFASFAYLPSFLWWAVPISITAWAVWRHHPRPLAWAAILFSLVNPTTISAVMWGNPAMWFVAALALGTHFGWGSVLVFLKPTLFPFALVGIWRREWWIGFAVLALVSLAFLPMWLDYVAVMSNANAEWGLRWMYSIAQVPAMLLPLAAWLGRLPQAKRSD